MEYRGKHLLNTKKDLNWTEAINKLLREALHR